MIFLEELNILGWGALHGGKEVLDDPTAGHCVFEEGLFFNSFVKVLHHVEANLAE